MCCLRNNINSKKVVLKNPRQNRFFSFPSQNWLMFAGSQQLFCRLNVKVEIEELFQPFLAFYDRNLRFKNHWLKRQTRNEYLSLLTSTYFNVFHKYTRHACWANINKLISTKKTSKNAETSTSFESILLIFNFIWNKKYNLIIIWNNRSKHILLNFK